MSLDNNLDMDSDAYSTGSPCSLEGKVSSGILSRFGEWIKKKAGRAMFYFTVPALLGSPLAYGADNNAHAESKKEEVRGGISLVGRLQLGGANFWLLGIGGANKESKWGYEFLFTTPVKPIEDSAEQLDREVSDRYGSSVDSSSWYTEFNAFKFFGDGDITGLYAGGGLNYMNASLDFDTPLGKAEGSASIWGISGIVGWGGGKDNSRYDLRLGYIHLFNAGMEVEYENTSESEEISMSAGSLYLSFGYSYTF